ncbi:MAG: nuclear transport factor 2 family protein [Saprospiraceae bacterium]
MKHIIFIIILFLSASLIAQPNSRTEQLVINLSAQKNMYMNPGSLEKLKVMLDDRMIFIHSNGLTETKDLMIKDIKEGKWKIYSVDIHEANVRVYKNNFAVLIGKGTFKANNPTSGGDISTDLYYTEVWSHGAKGWLLASRHASKIIP